MENAEKLRLSQLLEDDLEAFFTVAVEVLRNSTDEDDKRYVLRLLISADKLMLYLRSDHQCAGTECVEVMRLAAKLLPSADLKLARHICDQCAHMEAATLVKLLDVLACISHPARLSSIVMRLLVHPDSAVRSKAARLTNLAEDERAWQMAEADSRVLANAMEALWYMDDTPGRTARFWRGIKSQYPRVAANAVLGLYRSRAPEASRLLMGMSRHESPDFRRSCAWAMGETGDCQFLPVLQRMLQAESGSVRANVLRALARIRRRSIETIAEPARVDQMS